MKQATLDTNVYSDAADQGVVADFRKALDDRGWAATGNIVNIVELARDGDRSRALRGVVAMTSIARDFEIPVFTQVFSEEFLSEIRRLRPKWLAPNPRLSSIDLMRSRHLWKWRDMKADPAVAFVNITEFQSAHHHLEQVHQDQQKRDAADLRSPDSSTPSERLLPGILNIVGDVVGARYGALPLDEREARLRCLADWYFALLSDQPQNDLRDWTLPLLRAVPKLPALFEFWLDAVDLRRTPTYSFREHVRRSQLERRIEESGRNDLDLASSLLRSDLFITADTRLHAVLELARQRFAKAGHRNPVARIALVKPKDGVLQQVRAVLCSDLG